MNENVALLGGYIATQAFIDSIKKQIEKAIPTLERGESYTLEIICGKKFWKQLEGGDRLLAGRCMAYMVEKHLLPLILAGRTSANAKLYQLE